MFFSKVAPFRPNAVDGDAGESGARTLEIMPMVIMAMKASPTVAVQLLTMPYISMTFATASVTA